MSIAHYDTAYVVASELDSARPACSGFVARGRHGSAALLRNFGCRVGARQSCLGMPRDCPSLARALMRRTRSNIRGFGIPAWACTAALMPANAVAAERNGTLLQRSELSSGAAQIHRRRAAWDEHWVRGGLLTLWMLLQTENGLQLQLQGTGLGFGEAPLMSYGNRLAERSCNGTVRSAVAAERCCSGCHLAPVETAWGLAGDSPRTPQGPRRQRRRPRRMPPPRRGRKEKR